MADEQPTPAEDRSEPDPKPRAADAPVEGPLPSQEADSEVPHQGEPKQEGPKQEEPKQEEPKQERPAANAAARSGPAGEEVRYVTPRERGRINRRELLKLVPLIAIGAFAIPKLQEPLLMEGLALSDWASAKLFGQHRLEPTYSNSEVAPFDRFPYNYYDVADPEVDLDRWTLTVEGLVKRPGEYKLAQIQALPKVVQNTRHVCVEGWDVVGNFGGTRASDFLRWIGADLTARYLEVECADAYYESIDMATVLHPQTLFCYEMYGQPLDRGHGAPLRLQMPTKLGYKQAKYLNTVRVTNVLKRGKRGYWEDQGYDWFGGL
ncbi:MAG: molybdopterin-dependent oxidoreductase [Candidatus Korobacteraceae bacterium]